MIKLDLPTCQFVLSETCHPYRAKSTSSAVVLSFIYTCVFYMVGARFTIWNVKFVILIFPGTHVVTASVH